VLAYRNINAPMKFTQALDLFRPALDGELDFTNLSHLEQIIVRIYELACRWFMDKRDWLSSRFLQVFSLGDGGRP
jgi:hypothetical protein